MNRPSEPAAAPGPIRPQTFRLNSKGSEMLKEALSFIAELATKGDKPHKVYGDAHKDVYYVGGKFETVARAPADRNHEVGTLETLADLAKRFKAEGLSPVVWYRFGSVNLVVDDAGQRTNTVKFYIAFSETWPIVERLAVQRHDHKAFVRLLRIDLVDAIPAADLLDRLRTIKFENGAITRATIKRGDESLGREISARLETGKVEIPDEVVLSVAPFSNPSEDERYPVRCIVDVDVEAQKFSLVPRPDELDRVRSMAVASLADRLHDLLGDDVPAYYGQP